MLTFAARSFKRAAFKSASLWAVVAVTKVTKKITKEKASKIFWLMVSTPLKNMKVSWDYYYSILFRIIIWKVIKIPWFIMVPVTTNQSSYLLGHNLPDHRPSRKTCPGDHGSSEPNTRFGRAKGTMDTTRQACHGWISSQAQVVSLACQDFACCLGVLREASAKTSN